MKALAISLFLAIVIPSGAHALDVERMIEAAREGNGTVVESHVSANSGGQTAASGQTVATGDVSASSHAETHINADGSGGTVQVNVEKTENGVTTKESYEKQVGPDEPVSVQVSVEASGGEDSAATSVEVNGQAQAPANEASSAKAGAGFHIVTFFTASVPNFFKKMASLFTWF
jgi:hypothetical protein